MNKNSKGVVPGIYIADFEPSGYEDSLDGPIKGVEIEFLQPSEKEQEWVLTPKGIKTAAKVLGKETMEEVGGGFIGDDYQDKDTPEGKWDTDTELHNLKLVKAKNESSNRILARRLIEDSTPVRPVTLDELNDAIDKELEDFGGLINGMVVNAGKNGKWYYWNSESGKSHQSQHKDMVKNSLKKYVDGLGMMK